MLVQIRSRSIPHRTVTFDDQENAVRLIDQRLLPHRFTLHHCQTYLDTAEAIRNMTVRGAGAIGATAAYGFAQGLRAYCDSASRFPAHVERVFDTLATARPTAIDPLNALQHLRLHLHPDLPVPEQQQRALDLAHQFAEEDVAHCRALGQHGLPLIPEGARILTHCNAGWLAFVDVGSATAPLYAAQAAGRKFHVYCDETRPRSQGASLTAWELGQQGIPHHVIPDNAAGHLMQRGDIDLVIVGADRVLGRTGEVANKIGTYTKAVLAHRHRLPFYVAIPLSTLDWTLTCGTDIPIEERSEDEVLGAWGVTASGRRTWVRVAAPGSPARNPSFDVTPPELITAFITPIGVLRPRDLWRRRQALGAPPAS